MPTMAERIRLSRSVLGADDDLMGEVYNLMELNKPTPTIDESKAFYSGLTDDIYPTLCNKCRALEIDDSSFGGSILPCELVDGCQHLFFRHIPGYVSPDGCTRFMSLPVPFAKKDSLPALPSLTASAAEGCQFCALLISTLQNRGLTRTSSIASTMSITDAKYEWHTIEDKQADEKATHRPFQPNTSLHLFSLRVQVDNTQPFKLWFRITAPPCFAASWLGIQRQPPLEFPSYDDGDGRFTFKLWLDEHIKACRACQMPPQTQYPTRLIDVGPSSGEKDPRLIITKEHSEIFDPIGQEPPRYLALSYCWGDNPSKNHTTTKETLQEHCQRIPLREFPAACRDAVLVTRTLGFHYLWIDAFCIIQAGESGDDKDWQEESRRTSAIYRNAFLTIVPLSSHSNNEGFLPANSRSARISFRSSLDKRGKGAYWMHEVPSDSQGHDGEDFQRRIQLSEPTFVYDSVSKELENSKWKARGWTFNEALMSPRKLKFGAKSVVFECHGFQFAERALRRYIPVIDILQNHMWLQSMKKVKDPREIVGFYWTGSQYHISHRHFTNPTDRLSAISSFAELVNKKIEDVKKTEHDKTGDGKKTEGEYIAGLFRSDVHRGLTWNKNMQDKFKGFKEHLDKSFFRHGKEFYKSRFRDGEEPKDCYVAPSWSWVSTPSSSYSLHAWAIDTITKVDCDIEAKVQLENRDNPFGRVKFGQIVLTSKSYRSDSMCLYMQEEKLRLKDNAGLEADMYLDWTLQLGPNENLQISDCPRDEHHPLFKSQGPLNDMHLISLIQDEEENETFGLIVIPFPNQPDGSWMRAGIFRSNETWKLSDNCPRESFRVL